MGITLRIRKYMKTRLLNHSSSSFSRSTLLYSILDYHLNRATGKFFFMAGQYFHILTHLC